MLVMSLNHLHVHVVTRFGRVQSAHGKIHPNAHVRRHENRCVEHTHAKLLLAFIEARGSHDHAFTLRCTDLGKSQAAAGTVKSITTSKSAACWDGSALSATLSNPMARSPHRSDLRVIRMLKSCGKVKDSDSTMACTKVLPMRPATPATATRIMSLPAPSIFAMPERYAPQTFGSRYRKNLWFQFVEETFTPSNQLCLRRMLAIRVGVFQLLQQSALLVSQLDRRLHNHLAQQIANATTSHLSDTFPRRRKTLPLCVSAGTFSFTRLSRVGTSNSPPSAASGNDMGTHSAGSGRHAGKSDAV